MSRFDLRASTYEDSVLQQFLFVPVHQAALRLGRRILPQAGAVLDVGCGTGRLLRAARSCYPAAELVGVDLAGQMVASAIAVTPRRQRIRYVQARAERLPFPAASFDLVFATLTLRHWADLPVGMAEVARVLRPTGMLVLADVFPDCPRRDPWGRVLRRRRCSPASAELMPLLARQRLEVAGLEWVRWFSLPDVQVLGLQPIHRRAMPVPCLQGKSAFHHQESMVPAERPYGMDGAHYR
ncbi:MAG TPA: class I SAM-dependent methyltransferase [Actinomycetes bacterium]|nr:class I SAM-dependent methyltransferase [Actinomycetes bacterium]